jgi:hypothetical protein
LDNTPAAIVRCLIIFVQLRIAAHEGELDVFLVLVAVADQEGLAVLEEGQGDDELGLGAGFDAEVIFLARVEDLFDDLAEPG